MIEFVPFAPNHLARLDLQPAQAALRGRILAPGYAETLVAPGFAWTGLDGDRVAGCAGIAPQWEGCARAWALFGRVERRDWARVVAFARTLLRAASFRRVEATVVCGFGDGCRFARALGFEVEGRMRKYGPDGSDHFLYARVK